MENKIPPLILVIILGLIMWGISRGTPAISMNDTAHFITVFIIAASGVFFCVAGILSFRSAKTTVDPLHPESASSLVTTGIYRISRNPMYVGFALLLGAWAIYLASLWTLLGVAAFITYIDRFQIVPEERALSALFGIDFEQYQSNVRRWL